MIGINLIFLQTPDFNLETLLESYGLPKSDDAKTAFFTQENHLQTALLALGNELKKCYLKMDLNADGQATKEEILAFYKSEDRYPGAAADRETESFLKQYDANKDGTISFEEFFVEKVTRHYLK